MIKTIKNLKKEVMNSTRNNSNYSQNQLKPNSKTDISIKWKKLQIINIIWSRLTYIMFKSNYVVWCSDVLKQKGVSDVMRPNLGFLGKLII